jgi:hypothetical protein
MKPPSPVINLSSDACEAQVDPLGDRKPQAARRTNSKLGQIFSRAERCCEQSNRIELPRIEET